MSKRVVDLSLEELAALAATAGQRAVQAAQAVGLPTTGLRDGKIVKTWPDGRQEEVKRLGAKKHRTPACAK